MKSLAGNVGLNCLGKFGLDCFGNVGLNCLGKFSLGCLTWIAVADCLALD